MGRYSYIPHPLFWIKVWKLEDVSSLVGWRQSLASRLAQELPSIIWPCTQLVFYSLDFYFTPSLSHLVDKPQWLESSSAIKVDSLTFCSKAGSLLTRSYPHLDISHKYPAPSKICDLLWCTFSLKWCLSDRERVGVFKVNMVSYLFVFF